jgi:TonB family protein
MKALLDSNINHKPLTASHVLVAVVLTMALLVPAAAMRAGAKNESAKNDTSSISGTVRAPDKGGVPGASVVLVNSRTLNKISTTTGTDGSFKFVDVTPGEYKLEITKTAFTPTNTQPFELFSSRNVIVLVVIRQTKEGMLPTPLRAQEGAPQRIRIGRQVVANKLIYHVPPKYPPIAKAAGIQGTVKLDAVIGKDGTVKELKVLSGHPLLVKAAIDAVRKWRFKPTLLNGVPVEVETAIEVNFGLAQESDDGSGK